MNMRNFMQKLTTTIAALVSLLMTTQVLTQSGTYIGD